MKHITTLKRQCKVFDGERKFVVFNSLKKTTILERIVVYQQFEIRPQGLIFLWYLIFLLNHSCALDHEYSNHHRYILE